MAMHQDDPENFPEDRSELDNPNLSEDELANLIDTLVNGHPIFEQDWCAPEDVSNHTIPDPYLNESFTKYIHWDIFQEAALPLSEAFVPSPVPDTLREWVEGKKP